MDIKKIVITLFFLVCATLANAQGDLHIYTLANKDMKVTPKTIEDILVKGGFVIDLSSNMNGPFKKQFGQSDFKIFTLITIHHKELSRELLLRYPMAGVFVPMGVGVYQKQGDKNLYISILTAQAQGKILGVKDISILKQIEQNLQNALQNALPQAKHSDSEESLPESRKLVTVYELDLDGEDFDDIFEEMLMNLEAGFNPHGFVVPADLYVNDEIITKNDTLPTPYDIYYTTSICKLKVIYTVAKSRPEASAFAPCTTMIYKKKDEDKIVIGFPAVYNWLSSVRVIDKEAKSVLLQAQEDFESILKEVTE